MYMEQPEGFNDGAGRVCKLKRSMYGLKQAPRVWNQVLTDYLASVGFKQVESDHCVFINETTEAVIAVWVDDLIIMARIIDINQIKQQLTQRFQIKYLGELKHFFGIHVIRDRLQGTLALSQENYLRTIVHRFGMSEDTKITSTPLVTGTKLIKATEQDELVYQKMYQSMVGSLMYAMISTS